VESSPAAFDLAIRRNLFLAIKEALNNAVKYSEATELFLRMHPTGEKMLVTIEDNGRGFSPAEASPQRYGLANMQQRIAEVGGECRITSAPGKGCRVEFCTPLVHARKSRWRWWRKVSQPRRDVTATLPYAPEIVTRGLGQVSKS
jgi:signal transduction histidine kinase